MKPFIKPRLHRHSPRPRHAAGMSLVELMIAMTIGLLLLTGVIAVFINSSSARNEIERTSRQIENGRYAAEILSDDLRVAGFYGELNAGALTAPPSLPDPCSTTDTDWLAAIPVHVQGYRNATAAPGTCVMANLKTGTDVVVVRRVETCLAGIDGCGAVVATRPYLQVSTCAAEAAGSPYVLALGSVAPTLHLKGTDPTNPALCSATLVPRRRYLVNIYFISTDNGASPPVSVPTLKRLELTGAGWTETPLVEGIEQLRFEYGIDNAPVIRDGAPDVYTSNPSAYPDSTCDAVCQVSNWTDVVTAKVFILARNIEASPGYQDTKTYQLGTVAVAAPNDAYRRHVYSALIRIANPAGRRDTP